MSFAPSVGIVLGRWRVCLPLRPRNRGLSSRDHDSWHESGFVL